MNKLIFLALLGAKFATAQSQVQLASRVKEIFRAECYRCHGQPGAEVFGNFDFVLDFAKIKRSPLLNFAHPEDSVLYDYIKTDYMPFGEAPLADADKTTILEWIRAGAPDDQDNSTPIRTFISDATVFRAVLADLNNASLVQRRKFRYFTLTHLYNSGASEGDLEKTRQALGKLLNSLSWAPAVVAPTALDAQKTVYRIDISALGWTDAKWELLLGIYPYGILYGDADSQAVFAATSTQLPVIRADWFVNFASIPPLYHQLLDLPDNVQALESTLGIDVNGNIAAGRITRSGFRGGTFPDGSGVSQNNRVIERHATQYGSYWKSYDFAGNLGRQNIFQNPLGPGGGSFGFVQAGGEVIFNLPNGAQAYLLVDAFGRRIDFGPSEIVQDPLRRDKRVANGVSCMTCHANGMREQNDQLRDFVHQNAAGFPQDVLRKVDEVYVPSAQMAAFFATDSSRFKTAMRASGVSFGDNIEPVRHTVDRFELPVNMQEAASELGLQENDLRAKLAAHTDLRNVEIALTVAGIARDEFIGVFRDLVVKLGLGGVFHPAPPPLANANEILLRAAKDGDRVKLEEAIRGQADVNFRDTSGKTALLYAIAGEKIEIVKRLLQVPNLQFNAGEGSIDGSAYHIALKTNSAALIANLLLDDPRTSLVTFDSNGDSPLMRIAATHHRDLDSLLDRMARVGIGFREILNRPNAQDLAPIHVAVYRSCDVELMTFLLDQPSIDFNLRVGTALGSGFQDATPLFIAKTQQAAHYPGCAYVVPMLQSRGAQDCSAWQGCVQP